MYVWRIPLPLFAAFIASTALALVWLVVFGVRRRARNVVHRGVLLGIAVASSILSPLLVHAIAGDELQEMAKLGVYTHYSTLLYLAPAFAVASLFALSRLVLPVGGEGPALRWHLSFWAIAFAFALLNIANWCSPGWCHRFGFPFSYSWWSDAIIIMNAKNLTAGTSYIALGANIALFLFAVAGLRLAYRRSVTVRFPPHKDSAPTP